MQITINIDKDQITELVTQEIVHRIVSDNNYIGREASYGIRNGIEKAVKQYVYSQKDEIIKRCVNRATKEIVRKSVPKLIEKETNILYKNFDWIPVKSGNLPNKDGMYNVTFEDGYTTSVEWEDGDWQLWADSGDIIAWMPMPERYIPD